MEHFDNWSRDANGVQLPQEVLDAIVTLTKAGLLNWNGTEGVARFAITGDYQLDAGFEEDDIDSGTCLQMTPNQKTALTLAATEDT